MCCSACRVCEWNHVRIIRLPISAPDIGTAAQSSFRLWYRILMLVRFVGMLYSTMISRVYMVCIADSKNTMINLENTIRIGGQIHGG